MNFITKSLSNTNVYSDKLQIVKSKKKMKRQIFCNCTYFVRMALKSVSLRYTVCLVLSNFEFSAKKNVLNALIFITHKYFQII